MRLNCDCLFFSNGIISIHAPLTGCDIAHAETKVAHHISIHAPLTGCDFNRTLTKVNPVISIHAPLTGCDPAGLLVEFFLLLFQSTHPLRDATASFSFLSALIIYFNPRTPYGMRQG